jgi:hypothetical protein
MGKPLQRLARRCAVPEFTTDTLHSHEGADQGVAPEFAVLPLIVLDDGCMVNVFVSAFYPRFFEACLRGLSRTSQDESVRPTQRHPCRASCHLCPPLEEIAVYATCLLGEPDPIARERMHNPGDCRRRTITSALCTDWAISAGRRSRVCNDQASAPPGRVS